MKAPGAKLRAVFARASPAAPPATADPSANAGSTTSTATSSGGENERPPAHDRSSAKSSDAASSSHDDRSSSRSFVSAGPPVPTCVIEVFTSDVTRGGRAVDDVLAKLSASPTGAPANTTVLVFHLDSMDTDDARDALGSPAFTARQKMYSRVFRCETFTPMAVVNGRNAVIATNFLTVRLAVAAARRKATALYNAAYVGTQLAPPSISLSLEPADDLYEADDEARALTKGAPMYKLTHRTQALASRSILHLAVVQDEMVVVAPKFHNEPQFAGALEPGPGRLVHNAVVRGFLSFFINEGDCTGQLPVTFAYPGAELERMKIVAYVSPEDDTRIVASTEISFLDALEEPEPDSPVPLVPHHDPPTVDPLVPAMKGLQLIS